MKNLYAIGQKVICNNPPVATPPEHLRTHDRNSGMLPGLYQLGEPKVKIFSQSVVRVIMELCTRQNALVLTGTVLDRGLRPPNAGKWLYPIP